MRLCALIAVLALAAHAQSTRELNDINWMEFRELVPSKINTVLLPTGTIEAHGVVNNGADNTAPRSSCQSHGPLTSMPWSRHWSLLRRHRQSRRLCRHLPGIRSQPIASSSTDVLHAAWPATASSNIIIVNGHGGPQTAILSDVAEKVGRAAAGADPRDQLVGLSAPMSL